MNEIIKNIMERRSIRAFQKKQITDEELKQILDAGRFAPSAMNQQSWYFVAVQDQSVIASIIADAKDFLRDPFSNPFYDAPTVIYVFARRDAVAPVSDASLAIENMFLAAWSLGIGSCWINFVGRFFEDGLSEPYRAAFGADDDYLCVGSVALGYPASLPDDRQPRREGTVRIIR